MVQETGSTVSDGLIFLDDLVSTLQTGDVWAYKDILESWETRWFAPLWDALASGRLKTVCIATDGEKRRHAGNRPPFQMGILAQS